MRFFDSHAHYWDSRFEEELGKEETDALLSSLLANEVPRIVNVATSPETALLTVSQAQKYDGMLTALGIHPSDCQSLRSIDDALLSIEGMLKDPRYRSLIDPVTFKADSDPAELFELHRKEDVDALRNRFYVTPLHYIATDGYAHYMRNALAEMDEDLYQTYLAYHFATCERQDMVGYSNHTLDIFRKD